jgi:hypothetical protein
MKERRPIYSQDIFWPIERVWYRRIKETDQEIISGAKYQKYIFEICEEMQNRRQNKDVNEIFLAPGYYTLYGVYKGFKRRIKELGSDNFAHMLIDDFTLSIRGSFIYSEGTVTRIVDELLERRHEKTGEVYRDILVNKPVFEGKYFLRDLLDKIKPGLNAIFYSPISAYVDKMQAERSAFEIVSRFFIGSDPEKYGWPTGCYQGVLSKDSNAYAEKSTFVKRIISYYYGIGKWYSNYLVTQPEITLEYIGRELIPPTIKESLLSEINYENSSYVYPPSYVESDILFGEDAKKLEILDLGTLISEEKSDEIIKEARRLYHTKMP